MKCRITRVKLPNGYSLCAQYQKEGQRVFVGLIPPIGFKEDKPASTPVIGWIIPQMYMQRLAHPPIVMAKLMCVSSATAATPDYITTAQGVGHNRLVLGFYWTTGNGEPMELACTLTRAHYKFITIMIEQILKGKPLCLKQPTPEKTTPKQSVS